MQFIKRFYKLHLCDYCFWICKEKGLWGFWCIRSQFSNCASAFLKKRLTWLIWDWQCENFCTHNAEAEIIACTWLTLFALPNHGLTSSSRFALIKQWLCLLKRQEDDVNTWQMNMLVDTSLHLIKYYHTCVLVYRHPNFKINCTQINSLHSKKSRILKQTNKWKNEKIIFGIYIIFDMFTLWNSSTYPIE